MKFVISSSELLRGILSVSKAIPTKSALPILENFLFNLKGDRLEITASDTELTLKTELEVENTSEEGQIAVPASHITNLLKELPDQPLTIETKNDTSFECIWSSGTSTLPYFPAEDYPEIMTTDETAVSIQFPAQSLVEGIAGTIYATADDEIRPAMNGILFDFDDSCRIRFAQADMLHDKRCEISRESIIHPSQKAGCRTKVNHRQECGDG